MRSATMRLENFVHEAPRPAVPRIAAAEIERQLARARSEGHARGYEEGAAAAMAAYDSEMKLLLAAIAEMLDDRALEAASLRAELLAALRPLVLALTGAISPALARLGLAEEVAGRVEEALRRAPAARVVVRLAPEMVEAVADRLALAGIGPGRGLDLRPDPDCPALQARVLWAAGFDEIDIGASLAEVQAALETRFAQPGVGDIRGGSRAPAATQPGAPDPLPRTA